MYKHQSNANGKIRYTSQGSGSPVVLLHGIAASFHDWKYLSPELSRAGYHTLAPDLLGHGESHKPEEPEDYTYDQLYGSIKHWISNLEPAEPLTLVGHSMGGSIALQFALEYPDRVCALVLIDPFFDLKQLSPFLRAVNKRPELGERALHATPEWLIQKVTGWDVMNSDQYEPEVVRQIAQDYKRASPYILRFVASIPNFYPQLQYINIPALIMWGLKDFTLNPATFPRLVQSLPKARGEAIPDCGHQPHLSRPNLVNQMVLDFLRSI